MIVLCSVIFVAGCGGSSSSSSSSSSTQHCGLIKKTKIALHLGVAYVAFHRYLYKPWRAGLFAKGTPHRKTRIVKAVVATLVGVHEAKVAVRQLQACGAGRKAAGLVAAAESKLAAVRGTSDSTSDAQLGNEMQGLNTTFTQLQGAGSG
jgi:hypothetical protein